ncbi:MAG: M20 family metallopeptidase [Actinobacteria bacterium]|nr:M20 family metallopeptidase [Actinomycetota bacterium]
MELTEIFKVINEEELIEILRSLIRIPSHINYPTQEKEISNFTADIFKREKIETFIQEVEPNRSNVISKIIGSGNGKILTFNGHLDTVPPNDSIKSYEAKINGGKIYGLGSCDMKGSVAAMLYSLIIVKRMNIELNGDLYFTGVVGEESGGIGTRHLIKNGFKSDYVIVGEPTELKIVNSHKGVFLLDIIIEGKAAHASMPEKGANAIAAMGNFIYKINKEYIPKLNTRIQNGIGSPTINLGIIQGGSKVNIVADKCVLQIDRRWIVSEKSEQIVTEIENFLIDVCKENKNLKFNIVQKLPSDGYFGPFYFPESNEFVNICKDAVAITGRKPSITSIAGWTDGATILHSGIPTLILGPGSMEQAHTADEWVSLKEVVDAVKIYLSLIFKICINKNC